MVKFVSILSFFLNLSFSINRVAFSLSNLHDGCYKLQNRQRSNSIIVTCKSAVYFFMFYDLCVCYFTFRFLNVAILVILLYNLFVGSGLKSLIVDYSLKRSNNYIPCSYSIIQFVCQSVMLWGKFTQLLKMEW